MVIFGSGAVVGKLGLPAFNPMLFAFIREACAGPILIGLALLSKHKFPAFFSGETVRLIAAGVFLAINQSCFIIGDKVYIYIYTYTLIPFSQA